MTASTTRLLVIGIVLAFQACGPDVPQSSSPQPVRFQAPSVDECCSVSADPHPDPDAPQALTGENEISWAFGAEISQAHRDYVLAYWDAFRAPLRNILGAPSSSITVTVRHDPNMGPIGTYDAGSNTLTMKSMPVSDDDGRFNWTFTHETIHAYQDAGLSGAIVDWAVEGIAVCGTGLVGEQLDGLRAFHTLADPAFLGVQYDALSQMGPQALSGSPRFGSGHFQFHRYVAAGGFWWILTCAQSRTVPSNWAGYDYLARLCGRLHEAGRRYTQSDVIASLQETAGERVDGKDAGTWATAQPITRIDAPAGTFIWAACAGILTDACHWLGDGLLYLPFQRSYPGGPATPLFNRTVTIRVWNSKGTLVWETQDIAPNLPFMIPHGVQLPYSIRNTPGAYAVEFDGTGFGAGRVRLGAQVVPPEYRTGFGADLGNGVVFFDAVNQRVVDRPFVSDGKIIGTWSAGSLVKSPVSPSLPTMLGISPVTSQDVVPARRSMTLPYRRLLRIDVDP